MAAAQSFRWAGWLAPFAAVPLVAALARAGFLSAWARLGGFYAILTLLSMHWVRHTGPGAGWFLLPVLPYALLFLSIPALCLHLAGAHPLRLAVLPAAWMLTEIVARRSLFARTWLLLGQPLSDYPIVAQVASLAGPEALTALVLALAISAYLAFRGGSKDMRIAAGAAGVIAAVLTLCWGGLRLLASPAPVASVAVVQPVNSQRTVWTPANRGPMLERMNRLVDAAARLRPAMIVLPETAVPGLVRHERELTDFVRAAVTRTATPLLFGALDYDEGRVSNVAILITPYNTVTTYRKIRLVPFVEYTPKGIPYTAPATWPRYTPGNDPAVFRLASGLFFSAPICLEDTLPELARDFAGSGAQALVALVNTENFRGSGQALQHLRRARLTAISTGLPMIRSANSGISCSIDSRGRILAEVEEGVSKAVLLPLAGPGATLYARAGDALSIVMCLLLIAGIAVLARYAAHPQLRLSRRRNVVIH